MVFQDPGGDIRPVDALPVVIRVELAGGPDHRDSVGEDKVAVVHEVLVAFVVFGQGDVVSICKVDAGAIFLGVAYPICDCLCRFAECRG